MSKTPIQPMRSEQPCPECHQQCGWCSDYVWMIREIGCCAGWFGGTQRKPKKPCSLAQREEGKTCSTCGLATPAGDKGGGRVIVESRIVGVVDRNTRSTGSGQDTKSERTSEPDQQSAVAVAVQEERNDG